MVRSFVFIFFVFVFLLPVSFADSYLDLFSLVRAKECRLEDTLLRFSPTLPYTGYYNQNVSFRGGLLPYALCFNSASANSGYYVQGRTCLADLSNRFVSLQHYDLQNGLLALGSAVDDDPNLQDSYENLCYGSLFCQTGSACDDPFFDCAFQLSSPFGSALYSCDDPSLNGAYRVCCTLVSIGSAPCPEGFVYDAQGNCVLDEEESGEETFEGPKTCDELGGIICDGGSCSSGENIEALDSLVCCAGDTMCSSSFVLPTRGALGSKMEGDCKDPDGDGEGEREVIIESSGDIFSAEEVSLLDDVPDDYTLDGNTLSYITPCYSDFLIQGRRQAPFFSLVSFSVLFSLLLLFYLRKV